MEQCGSTFNAYMPVYTAYNWIRAAAVLCLWGVILVPVCKALHKVGGSLMPKLVAVTHSAYIGWLAFLLVAWLSIFTAAQHMEVTSSSSYDTRKQLAKAANGLYVTVTVFGLIGMLMAAASMIMALSRSSQLSGVSTTLETRVSNTYLFRTLNQLPYAVAEILGLHALRRGRGLLRD